MSIRLGVIMDPIQLIDFKKDTSLWMLLEAQERRYSISYMEPKDLFVQDGVPYGHMKKVKVYNDPKHWFDLSEDKTDRLDQLQVIFMRKDPPFDAEYIFITYILELAEAKGVTVINKPQSLRDANEKFFTQWFPQCAAPTLITREIRRLQTFLTKEEEIVVKPLDGMGGTSIFRIKQGDLNTNVILETITQKEQRYIMAQKFIPEITQGGDKRIVLIDGEPIPMALARIPPKSDFRGNLVMGAKGIGVELTERDRWLCNQIAPTLCEKELLFVGVDVIGNFITEINVTSPSCIQQLQAFCSVNIMSKFFDSVEKKLSAKKQIKEN